MEPQKGVAESDFRIFVALFPYDPTTMSPNPDASEDELPFREGQIIKVCLLLTFALGYSSRLVESVSK